ncbi:MAG: hypothetical protein PHC30_01685 [Lentisphaeria bacterium]|nr:hypothetical protein [Lentisphaeria bacterium]
MHEYRHRWLEQTLAFILSAGLHAALIVLIVGMSRPLLEPLPENIKVELVTLPPPPAAVNQEPPKPEPPKPEPPKPEPPKPEPPKPEPPKPQVIPTPAPAPKPPPPKPAPPKPATPIKSIRERLKEAEVKNQQPRPAPRPAPRHVPNREELQNKLIAAAGSTANNASAAAVNTSYTAQQIKESSSYAEKVVGPFLYQRWEQPTRAALGPTPVRPVEVSFTVFANGTITNVVIQGANNNQVLVQSIRNLFAGIRQMPPLSTVGSNAASLRIVVVMTLTSN